MFKTVEKFENAGQFDVTLRGSFSWNKGAEPVLNDIDVQIPTGKLTICAGPVAAGKTSFMLALMGELYPASKLPKLHVPSIERAGYTGQEAFIMPGTLQENILFGCDNIKLQYGQKLPEVLKGISFSIKPGMKVGICGRTGSGKISTVQALFRAVDTSLIQGKITIDGVDITTLSLRTLRNSVSIVTQEPFLWYDTIRNNLDVEGNKTDEQIWVALEQVGLKKTFEGYPSRLETTIEDSGSFSRGERQLLCMARVLLRSRRIVVLNEVTSSMDLEADDLVRRVVNTEMKDCTVIAVAHRIATIIDFGLIMVLEDGLIVEPGSPRQLLAQQGRFSQLAASQGIHLKSLSEESAEEG